MVLGRDLVLKLGCPGALMIALNVRKGFDQAGLGGGPPALSPRVCYQNMGLMRFSSGDGS